MSKSETFVQKNKGLVKHLKSVKMLNYSVKKIWIYISLVAIVFKESSAVQSCETKCSLCQKDTFGKVVKVVCVDISIPSLPDTVKELHVFNATPNLLPVGIMKDYFFIGKEDLQIVEIRNYGISFVWGPPFINCTNLKSLDFSDNKIMAFDDKNLAGPTNLEVLKLKNNKIMRIADNAFSTQSTIRELYLSGNQISSILNFSLYGMLSLSILDLSNNKISQISSQSFQSLGQIQVIYLQSNNILAIPEALFSGLAHLTELYLQNNTISQVGKTSMMNTNITILDISKNKLTGCPTDNLLAISGSSVEVNLSYNLINELLSGALTGVTLKTLDLQFNKISVIQPSAFSNANIQEISLYHNQLQMLPSSMQNYFKAPASPKIVLAENPWSCDCHLLWFAKYKAGQPKSTVASVDDIFCKNPSKYGGRNLKDLVQSIEPGCLTTVLPSTSVAPSRTSATFKATTKTHSTTSATSKITVALSKNSTMKTVTSFTTSVSLTTVAPSRSTDVIPTVQTKKPGYFMENGTSTTLKISTIINQNVHKPILSAFHGNSQHYKSSEGSDSGGGSLSGIIGGVVAAIFICGILVAGVILFKKYKRSKINKVRNTDYDELQETDHLENDLNQLSVKTILGPSKKVFNQLYLNSGEQVSY